MRAKTALKKKKLSTHLKAVSVEDSLQSGLTNPDEAAAYIEACLKEKGESRNKLLLKALMDIAKAHGLSRLSRGSESRRRGLYKALTEGANPSLQTLEQILAQLGLEFAVRPQRDRVGPGNFSPRPHHRT